MPLRPGSIRSSSTKSGLAARYSVRAALPSAAFSTRWPSCFRYASRMAAICGSSSTTSTRALIRSWYRVSEKVWRRTGNNREDLSHNKCPGQAGEARIGSTGGGVRSGGGNVRTPPVREGKRGWISRHAADGVQVASKRRPQSGVPAQRCERVICALTGHPGIRPLSEIRNRPSPECQFHQQADHHRADEQRQDARQPQFFQVQQHRQAGQGDHDQEVPRQVERHRPR